MNPVVLYFLLLKSTLTTFTGFANLPIVREDLVNRRHVLTDRQLNAAVAAGRAAPGPNGNYLVAAGYFAAGLPGAAAGAFAVMTPAFLILPLLRYLGARADHPRVRGAIRAVTAASAGLILAAAVPLARDALAGPLTVTLCAAGLVWGVASRLPVHWVMGAAALIGCLAAAI